MLRKTDFSKLFQNKDKSLEKSFSLFTADDKGSRYRGRSSLGPYLKKNKKGELQKRYYIAPHHKQEYFAFEIMQYLGVNTPKARFVLIPDKNKTLGSYVATKEIANYIPFAGVTSNDLPTQTLNNTPDKKVSEPLLQAPEEDIPTLENPSETESQESDEEVEFLLQNMGQRYELDVHRQVFLDVKEKKEYRISSNFFVLDLIFTLVADSDAVADTNFGFVLRGNRAFAVAIDKDQVSFENGNYEALSKKVDSRIYENEDPEEHVVVDLFRHREREQLLSVLSKLEQGLKPDAKSHQCVFDKIFLNERIQNTDILDKVSNQKKCENFKSAVRSTLEFYKKFFKDRYLKAFAYREKLRLRIANAVLDKFDFKKTTVDPDFVRKTIIEDLCGPYYKAHFSQKYPLPKNFISGAHWEFSQTRECLGRVDVKNQALIRDIAASVKQEFNLTYKFPHQLMRWATNFLSVEEDKKTNTMKP